MLHSWGEAINKTQRAGEVLESCAELYNLVFIFKEWERERERERGLYMSLLVLL